MHVLDSEGDTFSLTLSTSREHDKISAELSHICSHK